MASENKTYTFFDSFSTLLWLLIISSCVYDMTKASSTGPTTTESPIGTDSPFDTEILLTSRDLIPAATTRHFLDHTSVPSSNSPAINGSTNPTSTEPTKSSVQPRHKSDVTSSLNQTTDGTGQTAPEDTLEDISSVSPVLSDGNVTLSGWQWYGMEWPWYLIIQAISGVVGIVGNLLVILVLFQRRSAGRSTDTLIGGLAWADFLTSIFIIPIPQEQSIPATWLGEMYCKLIHSSYFLWVSVNASTYILMAISIERFIAISYPIYFNRVLTKSRIQFVILVIWLLSVVSTIFAFFVELVDPTTNTCMFRFPSPESQVIIGYYWFFLRMVIPMFTMLITQTLIARELHHQSIRFKGDKDSSTTKTVHLVARNRVLKMMFEVIIIYIICWAPNLIAYMGSVMGFVPPSYIGSPLHHTLTVLGFCNSCANPFIYTVRHPQFREALKGMLTCVRGGTSPLFEQKMESSYASRTYPQAEQQDMDKEV